MLDKIKDSKVAQYFYSVGKEVAVNYAQETKNSIFDGYSTPSIKPKDATKGKDLYDKNALIKHEKYHQLEKDLKYGKSQLSPSDDFKREGELIENKENGFGAGVYVNEKTNEVVVAYRCTANKPGVASDVQMVEGKLPDQYEDAEKLYKETKEKYPNAKITVTGYSLGGSLAELVASNHKETNAVTFSAFGTSQIIKNNGLKDNKNTINYTTTSDAVSASTPHPGTTRTIDIGHFDFNKIKEGEFSALKTDMANAHSLSNYGNLREAEFVDERVAGSKRILLKEVTNFLGNLSKEKPALGKLVPNFFFNKA